MTFLAVTFAAIVGGALGVFGLYLGSKLSHLRQHRKSEESQSLFSVHKLD